jgi:integrase
MEVLNMSKVTNKLYREFLDTGQIQTLTDDAIKKALDNITGKNSEQGKALLLVLYYTGARPYEVLKLKSKDIIKENNYISITLTGAKKGLTRPIRLKYRLPLVKQIWSYASKVMPEMYLFFNYQSNYRRTKINNKGELITYHEISAKLRYHFTKWFKDIDITPYFLRHNRFSRMMQENKNCTAEHIRIAKGARSYNSVTPYLHLSKKSSEEIAKFID